MTNDVDRSWGADQDVLTPLGRRAVRWWMEQAAAAHDYERQALCRKALNGDEGAQRSCLEQLHEEGAL